MRRKKIKRIIFVRNLIYLGLSLCILIAFAFTSYRVFGTYKNYKDIENTHHQLSVKKEDMKKEIEKLQDKDYLIIYAREHYIFVYDGETASTLPESNDQ